MSAPTFTPRRGATIALLIATIVWAVPNAISLVDLAGRPSNAVDGYSSARAFWMLSSVIAIVSVVVAASALKLSRLGILVLIPVMLAPGMDLITTTVWYTRTSAADEVWRLLYDNYVTALSGEFGWRGLNAALAVWLAIPVFIALIVLVASNPRPARTTPAAMPQAPLPDAWYVLVHGSSYGPYRWHELTAYASDGRVTADSMIRRPDGAVVPLGQLLARQP